MIYLLDVNAPVALGFINHEFHPRVARWVRANRSLQLASCSITELGFLRILAQAPAYGFTVAQARSLLLRLKEAPASPFISDGRDASHLPGWGKGAQTNHRWSFERSGEGEWCGSRDLGREYSRFLCDTQIVFSFPIACTHSGSGPLGREKAVVGTAM